MTKDMDKFWRPIAEPNPEVLARQLAVLKDWLSRRVWTPNQAACLGGSDLDENAGSALSDN